jgi:hypothetical protein
MRVDGDRHATTNIHPRRPGTHYTGGCVGSRASLDSWENLPPPHPGSDPQTVQLVVTTVFRPTGREVVGRLCFASYELNLLSTAHGQVVL